MNFGGGGFDNEASSVASVIAGGANNNARSAVTVGVGLAPGSGAWSALSDRDAKENLDLVDPLEVLERLRVSLDARYVNDNRNEVDSADIVVAR